MNNKKVNRLNFLYKINYKSIQFSQNISRVTFRETFAEHNTEEDLNNYLAEQLSINKLSE